MLNRGASGRFFVTPSAVKDFLEIFPDLRTEREALAEIIRCAETASHQTTKPNGAKVYRLGRPYRAYLLVAKPHQPGDLPPIVAVGPPSEGHYMPPNRATLKPGESLYWWRVEPGDIEAAKAAPPPPNTSRTPHALVAQLAQLADSHGIPQGEVGRTLGMSASTWQKFRNGRNQPDESTLIKVRNQIKNFRAVPRE